MTLLEQHIAWMKLKKETPAKCRGACEECGCTGNNKCGHECLDQENECTLDEFQVCPCCNVVFDNDAKGK